MNLKQKTILILLLALFALTPAQVRAQANSLVGVWRTGCQLGVNKQQQFTETSSLTTESFFQDRNCSRPAFQFRTSGQIQFPQENQEFINFTYSEIKLTVFTQLAVDDFNARKVCGFENWKTAKEKIITGLKCAFFNVKKETQIARDNDQKFGIYKGEKDQLFFGQLTHENDGSSPGKRPLKLSPEAYLKTDLIQLEDD